jgi:hypothetical protein
MARRNSPSLEERSQASRQRSAPSPESGVLAAHHHVWVTDAPGHPGRYAGLLLEWRRHDGQWLGLVAYVMPEPHEQRVRLVQRWVPAAVLSPVLAPLRDP